MEVFNVSRDERFRLSSTSRGNQIKWVKGNKFLKADTMGYESIAEVLATEVAMATKGLNYVDYSLCKIVQDTTISYYGCVSDIFTKDDEMLVSVDKMVVRCLGSITERNKFYKKNKGIDLVKNLSYICSEVSGISQDDIMLYWSNIVKLDAIILNEDRHFNNISFLKDKNGSYSLCPIFDNGLSFLSDVKDYPLDERLYDNIKRVKSKPFNSDFIKQVGYFKNYDLLHIDCNSLYERLNNCLVDFKIKEFNRALKVLKNRLDLLRGVAWK